ncbi:MAG: AAA family ATPase [Sideroxydans sp.]|nr:AAA family ATPase [Sideroxydans sp.]
MSQQNTKVFSDTQDMQRQRDIEDLLRRMEISCKKPLRFDVVTALSQKLQDHFGAQDIQFTIQGKNLDVDEAFGVNGLLLIFFNAINDRLDEIAPGFKWYTVPEPKALAEVSIRLEGDAFDCEAILRISDSIVRIVDSLELIGNLCSVDPLYEAFYKQALEGALDCRPEGGYQDDTSASELAKGYFACDVSGSVGYMEEVRQIRKGILGDTHPSTLEANHQTAACLLQAGENQKALSLLEFNVSALTSIHGEYHEETLMAHGRLARACFKMGMADRSKTILRSAMTKSNTYLGQKHVLSIKLGAELDNVLKNHPDKVEAEVSESIQNIEPDQKQETALESFITVCDSKLFHERLGQESDKDNEKRLGGLKGITKPKKVMHVPAQALAEIERLGEEQPNFAEVTELIINTLHAQMITGRSAQLPPLLLSGAPGVGKTRYIKRIAKILGVAFADIQLAGVPDAFRICGLSRYWGTAGEGTVAHLFATQDIANPIFLLDEIDKTKKDEKSDPLSVILLLLEKESSKCFKDSFIDIPLDISHASFIATANDISELPEPLVSRFHHIEVQPLDYAGRCMMVKTTYQELLEQEGFQGFLSPELAPGMLEALAGCEELNGRELKREILLAMQRACRELKVGQQKVSVPLRAQHLRLPEVKVPRPMGFV